MYCLSSRSCAVITFGDKGDTILRNVGNLPAENTVSHPRRLKSLTKEDVKNVIAQIGQFWEVACVCACARASNISAEILISRKKKPEKRVYAYISFRSS